MLTKAAPSAAHGRAPGQDGPSALGVSRGPGGVLQLPEERQRKSGAECIGLPQRRKEDAATLSWAPVKWGSLGGEGPMRPGRPLAGASSGAAPPKRVFGYFLHEQKVPRRRPGLASTGCKGPPLLWHPNEMGSEKQHLKDAVLGNARASALGFSLLFACAKSRAPPGETSPGNRKSRPAGRLFVCSFT